VRSSGPSQHNQRPFRLASARSPDARAARACAADGFGEAGSAALGVPPNATLVADLELLSWKEVVNVTDDGGVVLKRLQESKDYKAVKADAKVKVAYTARLVDGTVFDERGEGNELEFVTEEGAQCERGQASPQVSPPRVHRSSPWPRAFPSLPPGPGPPVSFEKHSVLHREGCALPCTLLQTKLCSAFC
jgi:hypothetical protein